MFDFIKQLLARVIGYGAIVATPFAVKYLGPEGATLVGAVGGIVLHQTEKHVLPRLPLPK